MSRCGTNTFRLFLSKVVKQIAVGGLILFPGEFILIQAKHQDGPPRRRSGRVEGSNVLIQPALFRAGRVCSTHGKVVVGEGPGKLFRDFSAMINDCRSHNQAPQTTHPVATSQKQLSLGCPPGTRVNGDSLLVPELA